MKGETFEFRPRVGPIERRTTVVVDGSTYEVLEGLNNIMVRRRGLMTIPGSRPGKRRSVPYWREVTNKDELREVLAALPTPESDMPNLSQ